MSVRNIHTASELTASHEPRGMMQGRVVLRSDDDNAGARQIWNRAVKNELALFGVCESSADVRAAVRFARLPIISSVKLAVPFDVATYPFPLETAPAAPRISGGLYDI